MDTNEHELKPCQCGSNLVYINTFPKFQDSNGFWETPSAYIECQECGMRTPTCGNVSIKAASKNATDTWNTRALPPFTVLVEVPELVNHDCDVKNCLFFPKCHHSILYHRSQKSYHGYETANAWTPGPGCPRYPDKNTSESPEDGPQGTKDTSKDTNPSEATKD
jgi:hypothetical protein